MVGDGCDAVEMQDAYERRKVSVSSSAHTRGGATTARSAAPAASNNAPSCIGTIVGLFLIMSLVGWCLGGRTGDNSIIGPDSDDDIAGRRAIVTVPQEKQNGLIRSGPSFDQPVVGRVPNGTAVEVLDTAGAWRKIRVNSSDVSVDGWMHESILELE